MKLEICLQATHPVEKLGKPDSLIDVVTRFHELGLNGTPNRDFQIGMY